MAAAVKILTSPGAYIQGPGALSVLAERCLALNCRGAYLILGGTARRQHGAALAASFGRVGMACRLAEFGGECCDREIEAHLAALAGAGVVVGVGGGKVLDTAKAVAHRAGARVVIAPTIASTDAPCSRLAVIYREDGTFDRYLPLEANPDLVLVDTEIIARAPARFLAAGMGDAMATWYEAEACRSKGAAALSGGFATRGALALARLCRDTLLEQGVQAYADVQEQRCSEALEAVVEANTYLSGVGFESGGLAAAHAIHNGLTRLPQTHDRLHGEKVAFGVLAHLVLGGAPVEEFRRIQGFFRAIHLPVTLAELGAGQVSDGELLAVGEAACAAGETMENMPAAITPAAVAVALRMADCMGRS